MNAPRRALVVIDVQKEYFIGNLPVEYPPVDETLPNIARAMALAVSSTNAASLVDTYKELVNTGTSGTNAALSPAQQKLLEDPADLLALLEKQFYDKPSIESLAWYGSVAEDLAYISVARRATSPVSTAWVKPARATWRKMIAHMRRWSRRCAKATSFPSASSPRATARAWPSCWM